MLTRNCCVYCFVSTALRSLLLMGSRGTIGHNCTACCFTACNCTAVLLAIVLQYCLQLYCTIVLLAVAMSEGQGLPCWLTSQGTLEACHEISMSSLACFAGTCVFKKRLVDPLVIGIKQAASCAHTFVHARLCYHVTQFTAGLKSSRQQRAASFCSC